MGNSTVATKKNGLKKRMNVPKKRGQKMHWLFLRKRMKNAGLEGIFQKATSMVLLPVERRRRLEKIMDEPIDLANKVYVRKI